MSLPLTDTARFTSALETGNLAMIQQVPKSDLHNHCMMGGRRTRLEKFYGKKIPEFSYGQKGIHGINEWIATHFRPVLEKEGSFEAAVEAAFLQAKSDGVTVLEMSIDIFFGRLFNISPERIINTLKQYHKSTAPDIQFRPEIGFARNIPVRNILPCIEPYLESGYFESIDFYDDEFSQPVKNFREIYRYAKKQGLRCKAHAGEFGSAESVRETVEELELDAVQHGISSADSPEIMKWLSANGIQLNVCPASNIVLHRAASWKTHPIRILFDHGVNVTVNTDDVLLFDQGNSEQYMHLYKSYSFSASELDIIRNNGLH